MSGGSNFIAFTTLYGRNEKASCNNYSATGKEHPGQRVPILKTNEKEEDAAVCSKLHGVAKLLE